MDFYDKRMHQICKDFLNEFKPVVQMGLSEIVSTPLSLAIHKYLCLRKCGIDGQTAFAAFELEIEMIKNYSEVHLKIAKSPGGGAVIEFLQTIKD